MRTEKPSWWKKETRPPSHAGPETGTPPSVLFRDVTSEQALVKQPEPPADPSNEKAEESPTGSRREQEKTKAPRTPADTAPVPESRAGDEHDLDAPEYYLNRELTWVNFNFRVLHEAEDERTPLLERMKFIAIVSSNLDEFFMKRIGGLKQQVGAGVTERTVDGRLPGEQIEECHALIRKLEQRKRAAFKRVLKELEAFDIILTDYGAISEDQQAYLREYYVENIYPLVTPQGTDPAHPFPFVSNLSLNLLVTLYNNEDPAPRLARVKVPVGGGIPRLLKLPDKNTFVTLESVIAHNLDLLFPGMAVDSYEMFRVTRNANTLQEEESADDLLSVIESELRERRFADVVRLEVSKDTDPGHRGMLAAELGLDEASDVFEVDGIMAMRDLLALMQIDDPTLKDTPHHPRDHPALSTERSIFHVIRDHESILLQHPYESFSTSVERLLREASVDSKVRAIKMTFYRTSEDSRAVRYLMDAALNGKQVAVVMELKARFDEQANIRWANRLSGAGIHVTYGVVGLKTHCKAILVVRDDYDGLRRYAHVGTGNYHSGTAGLYSDVGLLTCDEEIGKDLTELFNYLTTGFKPKRSYFKLRPAPKLMKTALLEKIEREIEKHSASSPGRIQFKMNSLEDPEVTKLLYRASLAGVKVDLIVRDTCRIRPGIQGLSDSVTVIGIVGRFLEHARLYYFKNGGDEEYYISSADCMSRNLDSRVEVMSPVEDSRLQEQLRFFLDLQMGDQRAAWVLQPDGSYIQRVPESEKEAKSCQEAMITWAQEREFEATRLKNRTIQGIGKLPAPPRNAD